MHEFAIVALLGLAILKVVDVLAEAAPTLDRFRSLLLLTTAVVAVVAVDYSLFEGFAVDVRESWIGTLVTGLVVGALASAWSAVLGWFQGSAAGTARRTRSERPRVAA